MASQWYYRAGGDEIGPVTFRELIERVRTGNLTDTDLVRPSWNPAWQRADTVVGLFHMARRSTAELATLDAPAVPAEAPPDGAPAVAVGPVGAPPAGGAPSPNAQPGHQTADGLSPPEAEDRPGWLKRLWSLRTAPRSGAYPPSPPGRGAGGEGSAPPIPNRAVSPGPASHQQDKDKDRPRDTAGASSPCLPFSLSPCLPSSAVERSGQENAPPTSNAPLRADWSRTISAALARTDQRASGARPRGRLARGFAKLATPFTRLRGLNRSPRLRPAFRFACALAGAMLVAGAIHYWSTREALRFPSRDPQVAALRHFPVLGQCAPGEYLFLMLDAMLLTGAAAWFAARWLDSRAE